MAETGARQTHLLRRHGRLITKTYREWDRDQHARAWEGLIRLAQDAPGLGPAPVSALLAARPPSITMTLIPGQPIIGPWTDHQLQLLASALRRLWTVPSDGLGAIDMHQPAYWRRRAAKAVRPPAGGERAAYDIAVEWIDHPDLDVLLDGEQRQILGQGDPQPGNLLYDGESIRLVDFEDAGASDVCFELANFAEHLGTRGTGLDRVADLIDHDANRYLQCRRLLASFWLFRLLSNADGTRRMRTVGASEQAARVVELFR